MIPFNVCGHLNSHSRLTCENCESDLPDSEDGGNDFDDEIW